MHYNIAFAGIVIDPFLNIINFRARPCSPANKYDLQYVSRLLRISGLLVLIAPFSTGITAMRKYVFNNTFSAPHLLHTIFSALTDRNRRWKGLHPCLAPLFQQFSL